VNVEGAGREVQALGPLILQRVQMSMIEAGRRMGLVDEHKQMMMGCSDRPMDVPHSLPGTRSPLRVLRLGYGGFVCSMIDALRDNIGLKGLHGTAVQDLKWQSDLGLIDLDRQLRAEGEGEG